MKITQEADYGLRVVLYLCKIGYEEKVEARVISEEEGIPLRFLLKLLRKLTATDVIKSYRGVNGGYALSREPEDITMREIIEAIDGPICVNRCTIEPGFCNTNKVGRCTIHKAMVGIQRNLVKELEEVTFDKLLNGN